MNPVLAHSQQKLCVGSASGAITILDFSNIQLPALAAPTGKIFNPFSLTNPWGQESEDSFDS
jgi:hypothetical protein